MSDQLLLTAREVAASAAALIAERRAVGVSVAASKSSLTDVVTETDREAEALIRGMLADARPNDGFYGEESGAEEGSTGLTWVIDPIDGTVNFLYGIPHYAVSVAAVEGDPDPKTWRALAGCVLNVPTGEEWWATAGQGAFLDGERLEIAPYVDLDHALVATGFAYTAEGRRTQGEIVAALLPRVRDIRRMGTASLDLCGVAAGRLNAYFERGLQPWDHAAAALIASEAGATVRGWHGAADADLTLAAEPKLATELLDVLTELDAGRGGRMV
ncbi:inositol monophosphatase family protein [Ruicaihuangia caeni]|uniref:Inositol-1-monophosphatase n=1 Tax=Ruicaihuangia caeni TaxID=3042517 RepID=A0AAW6TBZ3_9MICO|nr:inositol monophosphatase family protein [Klugiella sp. YN-L-19]MDI2098880.1 inositol monophosphatase family protein [Klugiella sp. YN-L-19]